MAQSTVLKFKTARRVHRAGFNQRRVAMRNLNLIRLARLFLFTCVLAIVPLTVAAQNSNQSPSGGTTQNTQTTRTTETTQPTTTTVTRSTTQFVDPVWLGVGAVVLVALLAILFVSMRGRSTDHTSVVRERDTVIRRE